MTRDDTATRTDRTARLADGRIIGYAEYGDPDGFVVLNCHGGLVGRLDVGPADGPARAAGVRIVSPDRPGIGRSTRVPGRRIGGWAADAAALADALGIDRFSAMGWSMGGPYAAACAALLPDRVASAALVAGGVPFDWPCAAGGFTSSMDRTVLRMARKRPGLARTVLRTSGSLAAHAPRLWFRSARSALGPADVAAVERDGIAGFAAAAAGGLRPPDGAVDDYLAYVEPWGFGYGDIRVPVHLWQGDADNLVAPAWSEEAARRIPGARLTVVPGCGHFVARDHWPAIFAGLLADAGVG